MLEELGWAVRPPGDLRNWDGLLGWFRAHVARQPDVLENPVVRRWNRAAIAASAV